MGKKLASSDGQNRFSLLIFHIWTSQSSSNSSVKSSQGLASRPNAKAQILENVAKT